MGAGETPESTNRDFDLARDIRRGESHVRNRMVASHPGVFSSALRREHAIADEAPAHALTECDEHLVDAVLAGARCATAALVFGSHRW
jgi:hypothetical protein